MLFVGIIDVTCENVGRGINTPNGGNAEILNFKWMVHKAS
jgi:ribosomal protein S27E